MTIGGDQLTGKSTLSRAIASELKGAHISAGALFRMTAKEKGVSVAELSRAAQTDRDIDVRIEYATCKTIMSGVSAPDQASAFPTIVIEGRNPAVMAAYCRSVLGKTNIISIYLSCSPRMQARRFFKREIGEHTLATFDEMIQKEYDDMYAVGAALEKAAISNDIVFTKAHEPGADGSKIALSSAVRMFIDNADRDDSDRKRFLALYGFPPTLDYRYRGLYDVVIDTSGQTPDDTLIECLEALRLLPVGREMLYAAGLIPEKEPPVQGMFSIGVDEPLASRIMNYAAVRRPPAVDLTHVRQLVNQTLKRRHETYQSSQL